MIRQEKWGSYLFEIVQLRSEYSFGQGSEFVRTAFEEYLHPQVEAACLSPKGLKGRLTEFTLIGNRKLEHDLWMEVQASPHETGIGTLTMRGSRSSYLGSLPYDAAWSVSSAILAGGFRFIYLHGTPLFRGTARIQSISFYAEFDPENA